MEPGVDLDAAIVRKVFRRVVVVDSATGEMALKDRATNKNLPIPKYSTEMSATYVLVKYFQSIGYHVEVGSEVLSDRLVWRAIYRNYNGGPSIGCEGTTLSHAVCLGAIQLMDELNS